METIVFSPHCLSPLLNIKARSSKTLWFSSVQARSNSLIQTKPIAENLRKPQTLSFKTSLQLPRSWFTHAQQGLAALAISLALNFFPILPSGNVFASEFDVLSEGTPKESYIVDDAGVLSRVTRTDLKQLLSDLESRKDIRINFVTVRKLTSKADAFEYADQVLERWYPTLEEGKNKGMVVLVTSQKEGAITGGPAFIQAAGENILDATVSENLPDVVTSSEPTAAEASQQIVSTGDGTVSTVIQGLLFVAFVALSILTIGVIYLGVTDFLQKREKDKFEKEEAAKKKTAKKKKVRARARAGPRGFGQNFDRDEED